MVYEYIQFVCKLKILMKIEEGEKTITVTLSVDTNATHKFKTVHKLKF